MPTYKELRGSKLGRLSVVDRKSINGKYRWLCRCDCGNEKWIPGGALTRRYKPTRSCGCIGREVASQTCISRVRHGHAVGGRSKTLRVWENMVARCRDPRVRAYKHYGGRGISVCEDWLKFENFVRDMGEAPDDLSLERLDNDGPYSKENCVWANMHQQARNRRNTVFLEYQGLRASLADWAEMLGIAYQTLYSRVRVTGTAPPEAFRGWR